LKNAISAARRVADRFGVGKIEWSTLTEWQTETAERTLYVFDVRSPEEFEAGHLAGARNAPGGQLVQATDEYAVVRNARMVLVDDTEVRAIMTASWLIQMGWSDVFVLAGGIGQGHLIQGPQRSFFPAFTQTDTLSAAELKSSLDAREPLAIVDLATSREFKQAHIPDAWWAIRSRLSSDLSRLPKTDRLILTSPDGMYAHLAAGELKNSGTQGSINVLEGGTSGWLEAGLPAEAGIKQALSPINDLWYKPYERPDAPEQAMQEYLDWEVALVEQVQRDGTVKFRSAPKN
jgi:rhodanese-related sulfurtransferase